MIASTASSASVEEESPPYSSGAAAAAVPEPDETNVSEDIITMLSNTFDTCKLVHEKPTKEQEEWYYYCGKVINQISQTEEFQISREELYELIVANLLEHLSFEESMTLLNYLYHKNNDSMDIVAVGSVGIQPLTPFERMLLNYYSQQVIHRPLVGRRALAAKADAAAAAATEDQGMLLFDKKNKELFALVVLRYETREWTVAEPEDERDFKLLLGKIQTEQIRSMNMLIGFVSLFKMEYLVFKVKVMSKKRDKGARCDQSGKTDAISIINTILSMNPVTQGDDYKLTTENTKQRTQKELCVFQEFLLRVFQRKSIGGRKWFFTPCEALLCDIERLHIEK